MPWTCEWSKTIEDLLDRLAARGFTIIGRPQMAALEKSLQEEQMRVPRRRDPDG